MKSRGTKYLLTVAVLAVWGVVAWKIFFAKPATPATVAVQPVARKETPPEGDFLLLDYKDPFLRNNSEVTTQAATPVETKPAAPPKPVKPQTPPPIKYAGTIEKGGKASHIFEHSGLLHTLTTGEELEGFTLAEIFADSVKFAKNGEIFTIYIQR
jgi:hypothetical protein